MQNYTFRLKPGHDLFDSIEAFVHQKQIGAGCVLSGVGSLVHAKLRLEDLDFLPSMMAIARSFPSPEQFRSTVRISISRFQMDKVKRLAGIWNRAAKFTRRQRS